MKKSYIIWGVIIGVVLVGAGWLVAKNMSDTNTTDNPPTASTPTSSTSDNSNSNQDKSSTENTDQASTVVITYRNDGFSPSEVTIKSGTKVTVKNESSKDLQFSSDPHPAHNENQELNTSVISPGQSTSFTANTTGTYGYHNHLDENDTGTIVVQ